MERQAKDGTFYKQVGSDDWTPVTRTAKDGTVYKKIGADDWTPMESKVLAQNIAAKKPEETSMASTAIRKGLQGATSGFLDEISGGIEAAGRIAGVEGLGGSFSDVKMSEGGPTLNPEDLKNSYIQARNKKREMLSQDSKDYPSISMASEIAGGVVSPANKVVTGMSAAKGGATLGALYGLGNSDSDSLGGALSDTATGALTGAAVGKVMDKAAPIISKGAQRVSDKFQSAKQKVGELAKDQAEKWEFKSTGAMLKDWRNADSKDEVNKIGRWMLDNKIAKAGSSVEDVAEAANKQKEKAGALLEEIYTKSGNTLKDSEKGFNPLRDKDRIMNAAKKEIGDTIGAESVLSQLSSYIDDLAIKQGNKTLSPKRANEIKGAFDEQINYSRNPLTKEPAKEKTYSGARRELNNIILESIDSIDDKALGNALRDANKNYGMSSKVSVISNDRVQRENANKFFGLTDNITGIGSVVASLMTGNPVTGLAMIGGKKVAEKYGATTTAAALDALSKRLLKNPEMQSLAKTDPTKFNNAVIGIFENLDSKNQLSLPKSADGQPPQKGPDKWANDGYEKVIKHDTSGIFDDPYLIQKIKKTKSGKELLIRASDLKPGSEAMEKVVLKIKSEFMNGEA
jgi:hypothetical protein